MRSPKTGLSIVAAVAALIVSAVAAAEARRPDAGNIAADEEALRRKNAREQNEAIQAAVRRWTWAAMPLRSYDDGYDPNAVEPSRMARVTALAADASGGAIVGGVVRGYHAAVTAGGAPLPGTDGGVFLMSVDRGGSVKALRGLRTQRERMAEGPQISRLVLGPAAEALWVGGAMGALAQGAWVQAVGW